jgi:thiamine-monophosphate kinase
VVVATCDAQVEGVHFRLATSSPDAIGQRALAVNLSDIAAMGAQPRYALISLLTPPALDMAVLDGVYAGVRAMAARYGVALVGGNIARNPERLIIDITLLGTAAPDALLRRDGARPGDMICVTGALGAAAAGLLALERPDLAAQFPAAILEPLLAAQRAPQPQIAVGQWLAAHGATAALDVSDGLAADLGHLCDASHVGARIDAAALPLSDALRAFAPRAGVAALDLALYGGEDYQLLFTLPAATAELLLRDLVTATGVTASKIGVIHTEPSVRLIEAGQARPLPVRGWDHLRPAAHPVES